ncbi:hypothetical protein CNR22_04775 [Sphingobacteriaceae bacterium]|nr:hypothetical protein CNR22_04775 [Sphingobacteriaceae bacterium]
MPFNFTLSGKSPVSSQFYSKNIFNFKDALSFVKQLKYARNSDKNNLLTVFSENCGTCSTKHALLKVLAIENDVKDLQLILGLFKMNADNSPLIGKTLSNYKLAYIPEAHNYLRFKGEMIDVTKVIWNKEEIEKVILDEIEIEADQITHFKVAYHKNYLQKWIIENKIPYSLDDIWSIREKCILDLSN